MRANPPAAGRIEAPGNRDRHLRDFGGPPQSQNVMPIIPRQPDVEGDDLDFTIDQLGPCRFASPMKPVRFIDDSERVLYHATYDAMRPWIARQAEPPSMEMAGPRRNVFFDPSTLACGIVTCGGLCPGLNDVIRSIVLSLHHHYGVKTIHGFRFGYQGLVRRLGHQPMMLTPERVNRIHESGGSLLGSSR